MLAVTMAAVSVIARCWRYELEKADGSASDSHTQPEQEGDDSGGSRPEIGLARASVAQGAAVQREVEEDGGGEQGHLAAKGRTVVTLARLLREQCDTGEDR